MRTVVIMLVGAVLLVGCKSTPRGSWASREWQAIEREVESFPAALDTESMRHYAAATILVVLLVGCWSRVNTVNRRHAAAMQEDRSEESGESSGTPEA
ncbi:MAG: hypothetical protein GY894_00930 [Planctomycetes bacterium]|jgi:uncharacterized protein YcfL|nr:hypothetical protein [Planctomycetota bacterium]MCP4837912.1 hypothetical protein [Planctomycetota bacterium]